MKWSFKIVTKIGFLRRISYHKYESQFTNLLKNIAQYGQNMTVKNSFTNVIVDMVLCQTRETSFLNKNTFLAVNSEFLKFHMKKIKFSFGKISNWCAYNIFKTESIATMIAFRDF